MLLDAPSVLLALSLALLALGAAAMLSAVRRWVTPIQAVLCAACIAVAVWASVSASVPVGARGAAAGVLGTVDDVSGPLLVALFVLGATGWQGPAAIGGAGLALLAAGAPMLVLGIVLAAAGAIGGSRSGPRSRTGAVWLAALAVAVLVGALLLQGRFDLQFTAMRLHVGEGGNGVLPVLVVAAAGLLAAALPGGLGGLLGVALLARLLLDFPGGGTPGWWGVPVLVAGAAAAAFTGWRAATSSDLEHVNEQVGLLACACAAVGLGAALMARGTDVLPAAAMGVSGAYFVILAWSVWGGALHLVSWSIKAAAGGTELTRLGGLSSRAPVMATALAVGLVSMASVPFSAGFAGMWTVAQAVFGAARSGGEAAILLMAGVASLLGFAVALSAMAACRAAGAVLIGQPRSAKAARISDPPPLLLAAFAFYAGLALLIGLVPGALIRLVQPGVRVLTGVAADSAADAAGLLHVSAVLDAVGYVPLGVVVIGVGVLAAAFGRGAVTRGGAPWRGGGLDPVAQDPTPDAPVIRGPDVRGVQAAMPIFLLVALGGVLAFVVGWGSAR